MILVTLRRDPVDLNASDRDADARLEAIRQYRAAEAFHRTLAEDLAASCPERPCDEAKDHRRHAEIADTAAWREEHDL